MHRSIPLPRSVFALFALVSTSLANPGTTYDVVVYGGTSGGVTAAVQVAKMGKKVALVSPTQHLGGMTSSGLGWTDLGKVEILGGLSREFYHRIYQHYQTDTPGELSAAWNLQTRADYGNNGQGAPAFNSATETASVFEPKVAEAVFDELIAENHIPVFTARLDLANGVIMEGERIIALKMEDGREFRGRMFVDATYEGDLLPGAGVTFTVGREANATYGETLSGIQVEQSTKNQLPNGIDPYVVEGDPSSGLLPGVNADAGGADGTADDRLQAYCFRMCLTGHGPNRVAIEQPVGYDEADYEILFRAIEAGQKSGFFKFDAMPNFKTDSNNTGGISTDFIGMNYGDDWDWTTLNHEQRDALAAKHRDWQLGLIWTLQHHPRVAAANGGSNIYQNIGLPADEFTDNGHWPWQIYVREGRRMVSDYVMQEKNCVGARKAEDSVGLAAYAMDSHHTQRTVKNGMVKNEGDVQIKLPNPYPISYRSIIPKAGECENLVVPWSISATHMAFGSIRMEPVFMTLGQSAATAAVLALNDGISVQELTYEKLAPVLRADGQALAWDEAGTSGIIQDTEDETGVTIVGNWPTSTSVTGYHGAYYVSDFNELRGEKSIRFTPTLPRAGKYQVSIRWTQHANRATNVPITIDHDGGTFTTTVNQQQGGGTWNALGTFDFSANGAANLLITNTGTNGYVVADAVLWTPIGIPPEVSVVTSRPDTVRGSSRPVDFIVSRDGGTNSALEVFYTLSGNADPSALSPALTGSVTIPAGKREVRITLTALGVSIPEGVKALTFTLAGNEAYELSAASAATVTLRDSAFDSWRLNRFTSVQLGTAAISGALADPDGNGVPNLLEFFSGGFNPPTTLLVQHDDVLYFRLRRSSAASELNFSIEQSVDLNQWAPCPELPAFAPFQSVGDYEEISIPLDLEPNLLTPGQRFFRLSVAE